MSILTVSIDNNFLILAILLTLIIITLRISIKSSGYWKSLIGVTGALIIAFGVIFHGWIKDGELISEILQVAVILDTFFIVIGLILITIGIINFFSVKKENKKME